MPGNGQFTPGPILHYVIITPFSTTTAFYLGTHVTSPKERAEYYEIPIYNDLGGRSARFQSVADGEEWKISTTLNRFDYNVVRALRYLKSGIAFTPGGFPNPLAFPIGTTIVPELGTVLPSSRGTLVMGQQDFELILINTFAASSAAGLPTTAAIDLHSMRGYSSCSITAYEEDQETTRVKEVSMAIESRGLFNPTLATVNGTPARGFDIYYEYNFIPSTLTFSPVN